MSGAAVDLQAADAEAALTVAPAAAEKPVGGVSETTKKKDDEDGGSEMDMEQEEDGAAEFVNLPEPAAPSAVVALPEPATASLTGAPVNGSAVSAAIALGGATVHADSPVPGIAAAAATDVQPASSAPVASTSAQQLGDSGIAVDPKLLEAGRQNALAFAQKTRGAGPLSKAAVLAARIQRDPLDADARLALIADAEQKGDLDRTRDAYEELLKVFPDAAQQWIAYAELELQHGLFPRVEAIFGRCLRSSTSVDLWRFYLNYIRRVNPISLADAAQTANARAVISKSFEFVLQHIGQDLAAGAVWMDYVSFLKEGENRGSWEDQQRLDLLRKTYQRAVCIPLDNVEGIWQDYNQFENGISKMTAKKFLQERSPAYMTARTVARELKRRFTTGLLAQNAIPRRPDFASSSADADLIRNWKGLIAYEEQNPLVLDEASGVQFRVQYTIKKALVALRFFPEIWYVAAAHYINADKVAEAQAVLKSGIEANPSSLLIAYTLADHEESQKNFPAAHQIYDDLVARYTTELTALEAAGVKETEEALKAVDAQASLDESAAEASGQTGGEGKNVQKLLEEKEEIKAAIKARRKPAIDEATTTLSNVWITQMRFARRAEGLKPFRTIFTKARRSGHLTWHVFEASATIELHWNKDAKVANNVFELGLKTFGDVPEYVIHYLDYLIKSGNDSNARALFERSVAKIDATHAKQLWDRWAEYEYEYSDLAAVQKFHKRYTEAFPDVAPVEEFIKRHGYLGVNDSIAREVGLSVSSGGRSRQRSRSDSPRGIGKRPASPHGNGNGLERNAYTGRPADGPSATELPDAKRLKSNHNRPSSSPAPGDTAAPPGGWRRAPLPPGPTNHTPVPSNPPPAMRGPPGPPLFWLSNRRDRAAPLPDGVLHFLSLLPPVQSFNGPILDSNLLFDVISSTMLPAPGSAPPRAAGPSLGGPNRFGRR